MSKFMDTVKKSFEKKVKIFEQEFYYFGLFMIILFLMLSCASLTVFIFALINNNFYLSVVDICLFTFNSGFVYWNYLLNKIKLSLEKVKNT